MTMKVRAGTCAADRKSLLLCACAFFGMTAAITATAVAQTAASPSADKPQYLFLGDPAGIGKATQAGDWRKLKALSEAGLPDPARTYALASYYRSVFQIALSSKYAKMCYQEGLKLLPGRKVNFFPVQCGDLLAGNYLIEGQIAKWAKAMQMARDKVCPIVANITHQKNIIFPNFGVIGNLIDMKDFYDFPVETIAGMEGKNIVIPRVLATGKKPPKGVFHTPICALGIRCFGPRYYYVKANVNGHDLVGVLDTGSNFTVVTPSEAKRLGVHPKPSPFYHLTSALDAHANAHLGYARSIRIKTTGKHDIVLRNVPVMVGGELPSDIPIVLGLNVISKFARVSIRQNSVVVNPDEVGSQCEEPMHVQSTLNGSYTIFFEYLVDGRAQDVAVDTGENQYISGTSIASAQRVSARTVVVPQVRGTGNAEAPFYPAHITFGSGDHEKHLTIPVFQNYKQTYPYTIGSDILQDYSIFLDFVNGKACLVPK